MYVFVQCNYFFLNSATLICRGTDISKYFNSRQRESTVLLTILLLNLYHSLSRFSRWQTDDVFLTFSKKIGLDISCKGSQTIFSGKNKKKLSADIFTKILSESIYYLLMCLKLLDKW